MKLTFSALCVECEEIVPVQSKQCPCCTCSSIIPLSTIAHQQEDPVVSEKLERWRKAAHKAGWTPELFQEPKKTRPATAPPPVESMPFMLSEDERDSMPSEPMLEDETDASEISWTRILMWVFIVGMVLASTYAWFALLFNGKVG